MQRGILNTCTADPLVVLLFGDLLDLVEKLANAQLQFGQLVALHDLLVVVGVLAHLNV